MSTDGTVIAVVVVGVMIATITDVRSLVVRNWLTVPLLVGGLLYHAVTGGINGFGESLLGAILVLAILIVPFILGALGAGDVKLVAALAAWLGTVTTFQIAAVGLFATAIYSFIVLIQQGRLADSWLYFKVSLLRLQMVASHLGADSGQETVHEMASHPAGRSRLVPFSGMVAFGAAVVLGWQLWFA